MMISPATDRPAETIVLTKVPPLMALYGKALAPDLEALAHKVARLLPVGARPVVESSHTTLPARTYSAIYRSIDSEQLAAYQTLFGLSATTALPAGFLHVLAFPLATAHMVASDFPLPLLGMVHLANRIEVARTVQADEELEVFAWSRDLRGHAKGTAVDIVAEIHVAGEVVWRGVSTYLAKGKYLLGRGNDATTQRAEFVPPLPTAQWKLSAHTGRDYAAVSGDRNPIHLSALSAKPFGYPKAIAHGMYTAARALEEARALRPESYVWSVEFAKPVLLPGTVSVAITKSSTAQGASDVTYVGWNARKGSVHFTGSISALN